MAGRPKTGNLAPERVVGVVIYRLSEGKPQFLLLRMLEGCGLPQRRVWPGEGAKETATRVVAETPGVGEIDLVGAPRYRSVSQYPGWDPLFNREVLYHATYYLGEAGPPDSRGDELGSGAEWMSFEDALAALEGSPFVEPLRQADRVIRGTEEV